MNNKTIAVMQPYLFPYIGYWQLINAVDTFVIYDDVNFIKGGYINRNYILVNGKSQRFTLELIKASPNKLIKEIEIGNNSSKILKTIEMSYKKAPNFKEIFPMLSEILNNEEKNLAKFIEFSLKKISDYLELDTEFIYSSSIKKDNSLKGQDKIIEICKRLGAKIYINAIGGKELYEAKEFQKANIALKFLQTKEIKYKQFGSEFIPNLSIIDVLMFNKKNVVKKFLMEYKLI